MKKIYILNKHKEKAKRQKGGFKKRLLKSLGNFYEYLFEANSKNTSETSKNPPKK